jgi:hypothetical protein
MPARLLVATLALLLVAPFAARAAGSGHGVVVARGRSPRGVAWRARAFRDGRGVTVAFPGHESGYLPGSVQRLSLFRDRRVDRFGEADVAGITAARVVWVELHFRGGRTLGIAPQPAPAALRRTHRWLRGVRFFDRFVPARWRPSWAAVYDARGRRLGVGRGGSPIDVAP